MSSVVDPHWFQCGIQGSDDQKLENFKKQTLLITNGNVFDPLSSMKDVKAATGKACSPQREHPALQNIKFLHFFCGSFMPFWIRIRILRILIQLIKINADPFRSVSTTLQVKRAQSEKRGVLQVR
jgi:hypothetical protein